MQVLLEVYDSTAGSYKSDEGQLDVLAINAIDLNFNRAHHVMDLVLQVNQWMEEGLQLLEAFAWGKFNCWEKTSKRPDIIAAISAYVTLPRDILMGSLGLVEKPRVETICGKGDYVPDQALDDMNEMYVHTYTYVTTAAKVSFESGVPMGKGLSLASSMSDGIDQMAQRFRDLNIKSGKDAKEIVGLQNQAIIQGRVSTDHKKTISALQEERLESRMVVESLKGALKNSREENRKLQIRQEKEGDAIFNSLNRKINERDEQLEVATSRIRDLERDLKKNETQSAKEAKKEQARTTVS